MRSFAVVLLIGAVFGIVATPLHADTLYVANYNTDSIGRYDTVTHADLGIFASDGLSQPVGLAFDSGGNLYVGNWGDHSIRKYSPDGVGSVFVSTGLDHPTGLAFDSAGNLYAANWRGWIQKIAPDGSGSVFVSLQAATALAFDSAGYLYAASAYDTIMKYSPDGVGSVFADTGLDEPHGLAFDSAGNLYAANGGNGTITKFGPDGVWSVFATTGSLYAPRGLVFDSSENLYLANFYGYENGIQQITPDGEVSHFASTPTEFPWFMAIEPIPEPTTFGLLGLGSLALVMGRRRR